VSKEEFIDDESQEEEYINSDNDPEKVLIVPEDDYVISDNEEIVEFDEILEYVRAKITDLTKNDHMMEEKLLDALRSYSSICKNTSCELFRIVCGYKMGNTNRILTTRK